jgi:hypothetical protein
MPPGPSSPSFMPRRFQNPYDTRRGGTGHIWDSKVTNLHWTATPQSVTNTYDDYYNCRGRNDMLWNWADIGAFEYAGLVRRIRCNVEFAPQEGLRGPLLLLRSVSLLCLRCSFFREHLCTRIHSTLPLHIPSPNHPSVLPNGTHKITCIPPPCTSPNYSRISAFGILGDVLPSD